MRFRGAADSRERSLTVGSLGQSVYRRRFGARVPQGVMDVLVDCGIPIHIWVGDAATGEIGSAQLPEPQNAFLLRAARGGLLPLAVGGHTFRLGAAFHQTSAAPCGLPGRYTLTEDLEHAVLGLYVRRGLTADQAARATLECEQQCSQSRKRTRALDEPRTIRSKPIMSRLEEILQTPAERCLKSLGRQAWGTSGSPRLWNLYRRRPPHV